MYFRLIDNRDGSITVNGSPANRWIQEHRADELTLGEDAYTEANLPAEFAGRAWFTCPEESYVFAYATEKLQRAAEAGADPAERRRLLSLSAASADADVWAAVNALDPEAILGLRALAQVKSK